MRFSAGWRVVGRALLWASVWAGVSLACSLAVAEEIPFREQELPTKLGVGYAVRLIDMNGDQRLDICIVDQERILWLENPNWVEHVLIEKQTKKDNVCFAPHDIDGDGLLDFAVGADWRPFDTKTGGTIQWIHRDKQAQDPHGRWSVVPIGEEPVVHRMNWADLDGDGKPELIVVPLMGRGSTSPNFAETGSRVLAYKIPADPVKGPWEPRVLYDGAHVTHNFQVVDWDRNGKPEILLTAFEGVLLLEPTPTGPWRATKIGAGEQDSKPNRGASEIKLGSLRGSMPYIATIEPWHGGEVVVYSRPKTERPPPDAANGAEWLWTRHVLDKELKWGHAVWCVNLDNDEDEELVIGVRDNLNDQFKCGLRIFDPEDAAAGKWSRQIVDAGGVAVEDLACGDLNGDGRADIVCVGRATHNVKIYWNRTK